MVKLFSLEELYKKMFLIRFFEESVLKLFEQGKLFGTTHTYIGQEANAVGIISNLKNTDIVVVTESNLEEVLERVKTEQGDFVLYAMTAQSFESLALNFEQIKRFIEAQNAVILYYEEAVKPKDD